MQKGFTWLDTGTHDSLLDASGYISTIQNRQGILIGSPEEVAYTNGWINSDQLGCLIGALIKTRYGQYLNALK